MRIRRPNIYLTLFWALAIVLSAAAQAKRPMTLVDLLNVPQLGEPQPSPNGQQILFVVTKADWKANRRISHIWRDEQSLLSRRNLHHELGAE